MELETVAALAGVGVAAMAIVAQHLAGRRTEAISDRRAREERFRNERLSAYSAFLGAARGAHRGGWTALGSRTGEPEALDEKEVSPQAGKPDEGELRLDLSPGTMNVKLSDLAAPIRLLSPGLVPKANDVVVAVTLFLHDIQNGDRRAARKDEPSNALNTFEQAAADDLRNGPQEVAVPKRTRRTRRLRLRRR